MIWIRFCYLFDADCATPDPASAKLRPPSLTRHLRFNHLQYRSHLWKLHSLCTCHFVSRDDMHPTSTCMPERCSRARAYSTQSHLQGSGRQATNRPSPGSPSRVTQLPQRLVPVNLDTQKAPQERGNTLAADVRRDQGQGQPGSHCLSPRPSRGFPRKSVPTDHSEVSTATQDTRCVGKQSADSPCTSYLNPAASCGPSMPSSRQPPGRLLSIPPFVLNCPLPPSFIPNQGTTSSTRTQSPRSRRTPSTRTSLSALTTTSVSATLPPAGAPADGEPAAWRAITNEQIVAAGLRDVPGSFRVEKGRGQSNKSSSRRPSSAAASMCVHRSFLGQGRGLDRNMLLTWPKHLPRFSRLPGGRHRKKLARPPRQRLQIRRGVHWMGRRERARRSCCFASARRRPSGIC
jgi:hypothetical protein